MNKDMGITEKKAAGCLGGIFVVLFIVLAMITMDIGLSLVKDVESTSGLCNITNVTYPSLTNENFVNCNCGRQCSFGIGYCVKVFVDVNSVSVMAGEDSSTTLETQCTFREDRCFSKQDTTLLMESIQEAERIAEPYVKKMNLSQPIKCYTYNDIVFLNNQQKDKIQLVAILGSISLIALFVGVYSINKSF